ncbi:MAG: monovalent cation/H+ antiporter complex subunit F [Thermodesulfobacteriota bacterium]|nr:monovalent cation/H+ antiporter complex subunit F [Thermodesulfobacteriota bacterium]
MQQFFMGVSIALSFLVLLCLYRAILGPFITNRIVGVGAIGTKTLIMLLLMGFIYDRVDMFVDISIAYALLNFIGTLAAAKYFEMRGEV